MLNLYKCCFGECGVISSWVILVLHGAVVRILFCAIAPLEYKVLFYGKEIRDRI